MKIPVLIFAIVAVTQVHAQVPDSLPTRRAPSQDRPQEMTPHPAVPEIRTSPRSTSGASNGEKDEAGKTDQERTLSHPPADAAPRGSGEVQAPRPSAGEGDAPAPGRKLPGPDS